MSSKRRSSRKAAYEGPDAELLSPREFTDGKNYLSAQKRAARWVANYNRFGISTFEFFQMTIMFIWVIMSVYIFITYRKEDTKTIVLYQIINLSVAILVYLMLFYMPHSSESLRLARQAVKEYMENPRLFERNMLTGNKEAARTYWTTKIVFERHPALKLSRSIGDAQYRDVRRGLPMATAIGE